MCLLPLTYACQERDASFSRKRAHICVCEVSRVPQTRRSRRDQSCRTCTALFDAQLTEGHSQRSVAIDQTPRVIGELLKVRISIAVF